MKPFELSAYGVEMTKSKEINAINGGGFWNSVAMIGLGIILFPTYLQIKMEEGFNEGLNRYENN